MVSRMMKREGILRQKLSSPTFSAMRRGQLPSGSTLQPSTLSQHNTLQYGHPPPPAHMRGYQSAFGGGAAGNASIGQPYRLPHQQMQPQQAASNRVRQLKMSNLPFYDPLHTVSASDFDYRDCVICVWRFST
jgi:hypothetical protein